ncbi:MAG TPA: FAD-binding oxidoreductase, partial [Clostridia bacterium]|nr:FAD-binding oxidoreductase [Clostridia bacterium]
MNIEAIHPKYAQYLGDESRLTGAAEGIVFPQSAQELAQALRSAAQSGLRATAQGARTGLSGGAVPRGGLIVNLTRMNRILGIGRNGDGAFLRAEGGATLEQIEREAAARGLFFPPDPSEKTATVGGM